MAEDASEVDDLFLQPEPKPPIAKTSTTAPNNARVVGERMATKFGVV
jgi:hypothetical protein